MSFFKVPVNPDTEHLLCKFNAHLIELNTLVTIIPLSGASSVLDMETWCTDWDEFLKNFGACQTEATEKHIALPLTAAVGAKGDKCITAYPRMQDAIVITRKEAIEYVKKMEEERQAAEEEEEHTRKAEEEEVARKTAEAEEVSRKTTEVEDLTHKTMKKPLALAHFSLCCHWVRILTFAHTVGFAFLKISEPHIPRSNAAHEQDARLTKVKSFLDNQKRPTDLSDEGFETFVLYAVKFFVFNNNLWRKHSQAHDDLGHKGVFSI
ncbi:hypothetical protein C8R48DRAFT_775033 [Suillus tomentosus]|nr:hypothetical protein C8R48DRAFT_775033 [Suillus tomentosus]